MDSLTAITAVVALTWILLAASAVLTYMDRDKGEVVIVYPIPDWDMRNHKDAVERCLFHGVQPLPSGWRYQAEILTE